MKRYFFYIAVIAAVAVSAIASSISTHASGHNRHKATGIETETTVAQPTVREVSSSETSLKATDRPIVIDFYATWCGPCKSYKPIFDKVAEDYAGKATFLRVDVDKCRELAEQYRITSIPTTVILTPSGKAYKAVGYINEARLRSDIDVAF